MPAPISGLKAQFQSFCHTFNTPDKTSAQPYNGVEPYLNPNYVFMQRVDDPHNPVEGSSKVIVGYLNQTQSDQYPEFDYSSAGTTGPYYAYSSNNTIGNVSGTAIYYDYTTPKKAVPVPVNYVFRFSSNSGGWLIVSALAAPAQ
jgi:hypothetical protein